MIEKKSNGLMNGRRFDQVEIVKNEDQRPVLVTVLCESRNLVDERRHDRFDRYRLRRLEHRQGVFTDVGCFEVRYGLQGSDDMGPETDRIVVALIQREPGDL